MLKILLAEDEPRAIRFIEKALTQSGMAVEAYPDLEEVEYALESKEFDVLILDRLMNHIDSLDRIPQYKQKRPQTKILVLTAFSEVQDRVRGLDMGADDYLGKPFHITELISRVKSLGRRSRPTHLPTDRLQYKDLEVVLSQQSVSRRGRPIDVTAKEFRLLHSLMARPSKVYTRAELLDQVWSVNFDPESNVVDKTVGRLRKKLNTKGAPSLLHAKRGVGYCLDSHEV